MPRRSITRPALSRKTSSPTPKADRPFAPGYGIVGPKDAERPTSLDVGNGKDDRLSYFLVGHG